MGSVRSFMRALARSILVLWPLSWFGAWWLMPPAPRTGWQPPARQKVLGFLADGRHVLTEESHAVRAGELLVWNIDSGKVVADYRVLEVAQRRILNHRYLLQTQLTRNAIESPASWTGYEERLQVLNPLTGALLVDDYHVYNSTAVVAASNQLLAYARRDPTKPKPEVIWCDLTTGKIVKRFSGLIGPVQFTSNENYFVAATWQPPDPLLTKLHLIEVPSGIILHTIDATISPSRRFLAEPSSDGEHVLLDGERLVNWSSGQTVRDFRKKPAGLQTLSNDGQSLIEIWNDRSSELSIRWRDIATGAVRLEKKLAADVSHSRSSEFHKFDEESFHWFGIGCVYFARFPMFDKVRWLQDRLGTPERQVFMIADQDTGRIIVEGTGHAPQHVSPDGKLLIMSQHNTNREFLWSIPLDPGLLWYAALAGAAALPGGWMLWRRWRNTRCRVVAEKST